MSIYSDYAHGYLSDAEFRSACAREEKMDQYLIENIDESDLEEEDDDEE